METNIENSDIKDDGMRLISLSDGTGMGDELIIWKTNAPESRLKELEKESCQVYINGGDYEAVPAWRDVLVAEGFEFEYVDSHDHVTGYGYGTSAEWMKEEYKEVTEHYIIENQPELL